MDIIGQKGSMKTSGINYHTAKRVNALPHIECCTCKGSSTFFQSFPERTEKMLGGKG